MRLGFSLVELSIILVILGLLTGGIIGGQSLMHAAELRAITQEANKYNIAVNTFQDKYFSLPGDMNNATSFWGIAAGSAGNDATCKAAAGAGTATCNGNADGIIPLSDNEVFRFWEHLSNAELIEGEFTGIMGNAGEPRSALVGVNVPKSKYGNAGFMFLNRDGITPWGNGNQWWLFGAQAIIGGVNMELEGEALTPEDAWNIDTKTDDGKPYQGRIRSYDKGWFSKVCTVDDFATDPKSDYDFSISAIDCALGFKFSN